VGPLQPRASTFINEKEPDVGLYVVSVGSVGLVGSGTPAVFTASASLAAAVTSCFCIYTRPVEYVHMTTGPRRSAHKICGSDSI